MWIFGYGSLVWKVDFPYEEKVVGYIKGYIRRFWQASIDHRGVPDKPGRVVTLVKTGNEEDIVGGIAYKICAKKKMEVLSHLDYREKGGYERVEINFHPSECEQPAWPLTLYVGTEDNPFYTGLADIHKTASIIACSHGPSGSNPEYLYNLAESMDTLGFKDDYLTDLRSLVETVLLEKS